MAEKRDYQSRSMSRSMTIREFAEKYGLDKDDVAKTSREELGLKTARSRDDHHLLKPMEVSTLHRKFVEDGQIPRSRPKTRAPNKSIDERSRPQTRLDPAKAWRDLKFGELNHTLWCHPSVPESTKDANLDKRPWYRSSTSSGTRNENGKAEVLLRRDEQGLAQVTAGRK